jgi:hypothetical protein
VSWLAGKGLERPTRMPATVTHPYVGHGPTALTRPTLSLRCPMAVLAAPARRATLGGISRNGTKDRRTASSPAASRQGPRRSRHCPSAPRVQETLRHQAVDLGLVDFNGTHACRRLGECACPAAESQQNRCCRESYASRRAHSSACIATQRMVAPAAPSSIQAQRRAQRSPGRPDLRCTTGSAQAAGECLAFAL